MNIIFGFVIICAGSIMVARSEWLLNNFGRIYFFDKYLGSSGGTRLGYKMIGSFVIFIGILVLTGMLGAFVGWVLAPLLKYSVPSVGF